MSHFMQNFEKRNLTGTCRLLTCAGHWPEHGELGGLEIQVPRPGWGPGAEQGAVCTDIRGTAAKERRQDALAGPGAAEETSPLLVKHMKGQRTAGHQVRAREGHPPAVRQKGWLQGPSGRSQQTAVG